MKTNHNQNLSKEKLLTEIERLKKELKKKKKYGLVWEEKPEEVVEMCKQKLPVLKEVKNKEIITDKDKPVNLLIEGDNYHALSVLNYTHAKKIDVIYIDPPYNTGNGDDFRYNDNVVDKEDPYKHSKWISFIFKRLKLSKGLLKETGVIFISINDAEIANLRLLCDEIFGEDKFVAQLVWKTRQNVDSRSLTGVSSDHEYVLVYRKSNLAKLRGKEINRDKYGNPDGDPRGAWMSSPMDGVATKERRPNLHFTIINPDTGIKYEPSSETGWRFQRSTVEQLIKTDRIIWPKNPRSKPRFKRYLNQLKSMYTGFSSVIEADFTSYGTKEVRDLLGREAFKFPKPTTLISQFIEQSLSKDAIVLDFFTGSGTTGHAVLELNKEDGGNRKFILCEQLEEHIRVCTERIQKVINGMGTLDDFVYMELAKWNENFVEKIRRAKTKDELKKLWGAMKKKAFLSYKLDVKAINSNAKYFADLSIEDQKRFLLECLDKNHLYVNYSEIDDEEYGVSEEDKKLNKGFYKEI